MTNQVDEAPRAEIVGGPNDGGRTEQILGASKRNSVGINGVPYALRVVRMPATEDRPERTVLLAIHPGWPTYPL